MNHPHFRGQRRVHLSFPVRDVSRARRFYEALLGAPPVKVKGDYLKFSSDDPSVNLSLTESREARAGSGAHYGIEVQHPAAVDAMRRRLLRANLEVGPMSEKVCCYSEQAKFWVRDPEGNRWEVFAVGADAEEFGQPSADDEPQLPEQPRSCCAPECCQ